jgi:hypothetical protein
MDDHCYQLILIALIGCGRRARRLMEHGADMCGSRWLDLGLTRARTCAQDGRTELLGLAFVWVELLIALFLDFIELTSSFFEFE